MKIIFSLLTMLIVYTAHAQTGILTNKYYISGSLSVGSGDRKFADSSAYMEVGTDSSKKGLLLPRGNVNAINTAKQGMYFHNVADTSLYSVNGNRKLKQLNDNDTVARLATKADLSKKQNDNRSYIQILAEANANNQRYDNPQIVKEADGYYRVYFTAFGNSGGDLSTANISYVESRSLNGPWSVIKRAISPTDIPNSKTAIQQSIAFQADGTEVMILTASYSTVLNIDSLRTRWFKSKKAVGATTWTTPVEIFNGNDYTIGRANNIYIIRPGYWVMPYVTLDSGTGNSGSSRYYGGFMKSYDEGETWVRGPNNIRNGNMSVGEISLLYTPENGYRAMFRTSAGQIQEVLYFYDTSFSQPSIVYDVMPSQNALSSFIYYGKRNMTLAAVMRYRGYDITADRRYIDLLVSDDGDSWSQVDNIDYVPSGAVMNEPYFYLDTTDVNDPVVWVSYSKTPIGNVYYSLYLKNYHLNNIQIPKLATSTPNNIKLRSNRGGRSNQFTKWFSGRAHADTASAIWYSLSSETSKDNDEFGLGLRVNATNISNSFLLDINNKKADAAKGAVINGNMGMRSPVLSVQGNSVNAFEVYNHSTKVAVADRYSDTVRPGWGAVYVDPDNKQLHWRNAGIDYAATQNFLFPLGAAHFSADSSYTDTMLRGKYITIQDTNGKYLRNGRDYSVNASGRLKLLTRTAPTGSDTLYVRIENLWTPNNVPRYYPLDTLGTPYAVFSFYKMLRAYNGYCVRLKSIATGETRNFGFGYEGYLDTFAVKAWPYYDSCTLDLWWDQSQRFPGVTPVASSNSPRFRFANGVAYTEFNGSGLVATTSNTRNILAFVHQSASTISVVGEANNVTATSNYGLVGNAQGSTTNVGFYVSYDNRSAQSRVNALALGYVRSVSSQYTSVQVMNNLILPNQKFILTMLGDMTNTTAAERSKIFINSNSAVQTNTFTNTPSSAAAQYSLAIGSLGANTIPLTGKMFEVIILGNQLTETQRINLRNNQNTRFKVY